MFLTNSEITNNIPRQMKFIDIRIITKSNSNIYQVTSCLKEDQDKTIDNRYTYLLDAHRTDDENVRCQFMMVKVDGGMFITSHVYNMKITEYGIRAYKKAVGQELGDTRETIFLDDMTSTIEHVFDDCVAYRPTRIDDSMRLKLKDPRTKKEYEAVAGVVSKSQYLKPDFILHEIYGKRTYFIEVERTIHKQDDFFKKLMKIHMLRKRVYFLFNGEANFNYHTELIAMFEKRFNRKFDTIQYAKVDDFSFLGRQAFVLHM